MNTCENLDGICANHGDSFRNEHTDWWDPTKKVCDWYAWMFDCGCHEAGEGTYV